MMHPSLVLFLFSPIDLPRPRPAPSRLPLIVRILATARPSLLLRLASLYVQSHNANATPLSPISSTPAQSTPCLRHCRCNKPPAPRLGIFPTPTAGSKRKADDLGDNDRRAKQNDTWDSSSTRSRNVMTTDHGTAIVNPDTWYVHQHIHYALPSFGLKVDDGKGGPRPALLEDQIAREKIMRFDYKRIPERVVHAHGAGTHGYFRLKNPIPEYSFALVLNETSCTTPMFIRFSTVQVCVKLLPSIRG